MKSDLHLWQYKNHEYNTRGFFFCTLLLKLPIYIYSFTIAVQSILPCRLADYSSGKTSSILDGFTGLLGTKKAVKDCA